MLACYVAVIVALAVGMAGGVAIGMKSSALALVDMLKSGELMRRVDIGADRKLP